MATNENGDFTVLGLGELVLRVNEMDPMLTFYSDRIGLRLLRRWEDEVAFLRVGPTVAGQMQTLTLFNSRKLSNFDGSGWTGCDAKRSTLHHFALTISVEDYQSTAKALALDHIRFSTAIHSWIGWRSIFLRDPEENTVELVCYDPKIDRHETYDYSRLYGDPDMPWDPATINK